MPNTNVYFNRNNYFQNGNSSIKGEIMKNKYQEALDYFLNRDDGENVTVTCDWLVYAEELKELVDKETPMKSIKSYCGKCNIGYLVKSRGDKYCHVCGYKIDWSKDDEK